MLVRDKQDFTFSIDGAFYHDRFVRLNYTPSEASSDWIDFGACLMVLGDLPDTMDGSLTGWGSISRTFISGDLELRKISEKVNTNLAAELSRSLSPGT